EARTGKTLNMNYGFVNQTTVQYSVWYNGSRIAFPGNLQNNTGLPFVWKIYVLEGTTEPTLLVGSQSLYLVYLNGDQPVVDPIVVQGSDFATLQFLDSDKGQPGPGMTVFMTSTSSDMEKIDTLTGGDLLLVCGKTVLEVSTKKKWNFSQGKNEVDNYSFPIPQDAIALSPDRQSIAFNGSFQTWNTEGENYPDSDHAIVVQNYKTDSSYSVVYDDTQLRLINTEAVNRNWLESHFEWVEGTGGGFVLQLKDLSKPVNWIGRYSDSDNYYYLYPVKPSMMEAFTE